SPPYTTYRAGAASAPARQPLKTSSFMDERMDGPQPEWAGAVPDRMERMMQTLGTNIEETDGDRAMEIGNGKQGFARDLFDLRFHRLRISQDRFAKRFGLTFGTVKNIEQERHQPSGAMR